MTPSNSLSLRSGTTSRVRMPPRSTAARGNGWSGYRATTSNKVVDMGKCRAFHHKPEGVSRPRNNSRCEEFPEWRGSALVRHSMKPLLVKGHQGAEGRLAKRVCFLKHCLKHRREIAG